MSDSDAPHSEPLAPAVMPKRSTQAARRAASRAAFARDVEQFIAHGRQERGVSEKTARCYQIDLKQYVAWLCQRGVPSARRVEAADVEAFVRHLNDWRPPPRAIIARRNTYEAMAPVASNATRRRYAPRSIARKLMVARAWHRFLAQTRGYSDPSQGLSLVQAGAVAAPHGLSEQHIAALLESPAADSALGRRDRAVLHLLCRGLTGGELCALRLRDLMPLENAAETQLRCRNLRRATRSPNRARTKRRLPATRFVSLDNRSAAVLEDYLEMRASLFEFLDSEITPSAAASRPASRRSKPRRTTLFFIAAGGCALTLRDVRVIVRNAAQRANLPIDLTPRALRHYYVVRSLEDGCDLRTMQARLGHAHLATAQSYSHAVSGHLHDVYRRTHPRA